MSAVRIARAASPGEVRAVAFDAGGRPISTFIERWGGHGQPLSAGETVTGRLRHVSPSDGGAFFELESGTEVFVRGEVSGGFTQGGSAHLLIVAEQRQGKLARARLVSEPGLAIPAFERWRSSLPGESCSNIDEGRDAADDVGRVFDDVLSPMAGLSGGGKIQITPTPALVAVDIDSAGRLSKGSAGARALAINREAVAEAARQIAVRRLGGLIAIDCVAPINREAGEKLRAGFVASFSRCSDRAVDALRPSRFGLLEAKIEWRRTPLSELMLDESGEPSAETRLLALFREVEREAGADRTAFFSVILSKALMDVYKARKRMCDALLSDAFSGRVSVSQEISTTNKVARI